VIVSKQPRLRVFFDSSVLIAGTISSRGASYALLRLAELALIDAFISPEVRASICGSVEKYNSYR
jgi:predicted nucleic acid-binding protein